jgi:transcriptional regulator NrdR family protein
MEDFKKCPYCKSEKVQAFKSHPIYDSVWDEYHEPCDCGDCEGEWTTIYKPSKNILIDRGDITVVDNE